MTNGISIDQRNVILVPFPFTDLSGAKKRPAIIISTFKFNIKNEDVICCLITSNPADRQHTVKITNKDMESGFLEFESKVKPYRIFTINKKLVYRVLGRIDLAKSKSIVEEINKIISIKTD